MDTTKNTINDDVVHRTPNKLDVNPWEVLQKTFSSSVSWSQLQQSLSLSLLNKDLDIQRCSILVLNVSLFLCAQLLVAILLIFIVTDLMVWGTPFCLQVSQRICVLCCWFESASSGQPFRFARPHWLNHHPVWLCRALQLSTVALFMEQDGLQPSLSTSVALNGAVSWFCSWS